MSDTRPPLDVALAEWFRVNSDADGRILPSLVEDEDGGYRYATADEFAREFAAAYQPTGPDDLAGLRALSDAATPGEWKHWTEAAEDGYFIDQSFGPKDGAVGGTYNRTERGNDNARFICSLVNWFRGVTLTGVRSSEVDGLREALARVLDEHDPGRTGYAKYGGDAIIRDLRALTGDTGPKVEPGPRSKSGRTIDSDDLADRAEAGFDLSTWTPRSRPMTTEPTPDLRSVSADSTAGLDGDTGPKVEPEP